MPFSFCSLPIFIRQNPTALDSAHKQHHLLSEHTQKSSVYAVRHNEGRRQPILALASAFVRMCDLYARIKITKLSGDGCFIHAES